MTQPDGCSERLSSGHYSYAWPFNQLDGESQLLLHESGQEAPDFDNDGWVDSAGEERLIEVEVEIYFELLDTDPMGRTRPLWSGIFMELIS